MAPRISGMGVDRAATRGKLHAHRQGVGARGFGSSHGSHDEQDFRLVPCFLPSRSQALDQHSLEPCNSCVDCDLLHFDVRLPTKDTSE